MSLVSKENIKSLSMLYRQRLLNLKEEVQEIIESEDESASSLIKLDAMEKEVHSIMEALDIIYHLKENT